MPKDWRSEAIYILSFHRSKISIYGPAKRGRPNGNYRGWGLRETAKELALPLGKICEDIQIALAMERREEIRDCRTREEALGKSRRR